MITSLPDLMIKWFGTLTVDSAGNPAGSTVIDGLSASQVRVPATTTYSSTDILAVRVLLIGTGNLTLSPKASGAVNIEITAAELTAMGAGLYGTDWYGRFDSVTAGAGMELLAYID